MNRLPVDLSCLGGIGLGRTATTSKIEGVGLWRSNYLLDSIKTLKILKWPGIKGKCHQYDRVPVCIVKGVSLD